MFSHSDLILADTDLHGQFFIDELGADPNSTFVVPVGAEEHLFAEQELKINKKTQNIRIIFFIFFKISNYFFKWRNEYD